MGAPQSFLLLLLPLTSFFLLHPISAVDEFPSSEEDFTLTSPPYTYAVQANPTQTAVTAIENSLASARSTATSLKRIPKPADPRAAGALRDCSSCLEEAVDNMSDSLGQMKKLGSGGGSFKFQLSNVQTWMSAALTNVDTCEDAFEEVKSGSLIKKKVLTQVGVVRKRTSDALTKVAALVNGSAP